MNKTKTNIPLSIAYGYLETFKAEVEKMAISLDKVADDKSISTERWNQLMNHFQICLNALSGSHCLDHELQTALTETHSLRTVVDKLRTERLLLREQARGYGLDIDLINWQTKDDLTR